MFNAKASFIDRSARYNTPKTLVVIPLENIKFNISNQPRLSYSKSKYDSLKRSIETHGIVTPVTIFSPNADLSDPKNIKGDLLDGFNRIQIAKDLGIKEVPAIVETSADEADKIILFSNTTRNNLHPIECGRLINDSINKGLISTINSSTKYNDIERFLNWKKATATYYESLANSIFEEVARLLISMDFRNKEKLIKIAKICKLEELRNLGKGDEARQEAINRTIPKIQKLIAKDKDTEPIANSETSSVSDLSNSKKTTYNRILFLEDSRGKLIGENILSKLSDDELQEILQMNEALSDILKRIISSKKDKN